MAARILFGLLVASGLTACASIPDVMFTDDAGAPSVLDASGVATPQGNAGGEDSGLGAVSNPPIPIGPSDDADAPASSSSGGTGSGSDGGGGESSSGGKGGSGSSSGGKSSSGSSSGGSSGSGSSSGAVGVCPAGVPAGADTCCSNVPCVGEKCASRCSECWVCILGQSCCVPNGNGQPITCGATPASCGGN